MRLQGFVMCQPLGVANNDHWRIQVSWMREGLKVRFLVIGGRHGVEFGEGYLLKSRGPR